MKAIFNNSLYNLQKLIMSFTPQQKLLETNESVQWRIDWTRPNNQPFSNYFPFPFFFFLVLLLFVHSQVDVRGTTDRMTTVQFETFQFFITV
jgi:hypothetical protein